MKYLKKFESIHDKPEVGDYILAKYDTKNYSVTSINNVKKFIDNTIGIVVGVERYLNYITVNIKYDNIPDNIINFFKNDTKKFTFNGMMKSIVDYDKDLDSLKYKIEAKKYNI